MRAKTVGFAISDDDRELLERLTEHYGQGNRSEFLRLAMKRMEHDRLAQRFIETREAIANDLAGKEFTTEEVLALVREVSGE